MSQDGWKKVFAGITTPEEVWRVTQVAGDMPTFIYKAKRGPENLETGEVIAVHLRRSGLRNSNYGVKPHYDC